MRPRGGPRGVGSREGAWGDDGRGCPAGAHSAISGPLGDRNDGSGRQRTRHEVGRSRQGSSRRSSVPLLDERARNCSGGSALARIGEEHGAKGLERLLPGSLPGELQARRGFEANLLRRWSRAGGSRRAMRFALRFLIVSALPLRVFLNGVHAALDHRHAVVDDALREVRRGRTGLERDVAGPICSIHDVRPRLDGCVVPLGQSLLSQHGAAIHSPLGNHLRGLESLLANELGGRLQVLDDLHEGAAVVPCP
mmetsp:Transcript_96267/g.201129  ORF Transcript_96267/g.201129 Transcript_96267/m.201129 type:complete len:252 (-) Transcript_96267:74-829(-)